MISVIVLAYNRCAEVLITIEKTKLLRQSLPFDLEIVVVDNASADNTSAQVALLHPDVKLISRNTNNGIAGWNDGFAAASHKYYLVLDDDSHVHSGLNEAVTRLEADPSIGILSLQIVDEKLQMDEHLKPEEAWKDGEEVPGFIGCGALIRQEVYKKIGGFAEWLFVYTHEFEYAIRCWDAGYRVVFFAGSLVVHRVSRLNRTNKRLRVFGTRNELAIIWKYFSASRAKYLFRIVINNLKFIKREGLASGYYVIQGYFEFLKLRNQLTASPVSTRIQNFYARNFWATKPILSNLKKRFYKNN